MAKNGSRSRSAARRSSDRGGPAKRGLPWPVWAALGGLVLVIAGIAFLARPAGQAASVTPEVVGQARLAVDRDTIDFGTVPLDKTVEATFKLTNVGDEPLQIEGRPTIEVRKGC